MTIVHMTLWDAEMHMHHHKLTVNTIEPDRCKTWIKGEMIWIRSYGI